MGGGLCVIVNPAAGGGSCGRKAPAALERLRASGRSLEVHHTERAGHATDLARHAYAAGHRDFVAVGGDGTSFEIVNGVLPALADGGERVSLGFLPLGTGNSFLRDFTDRGAEHALEALLAGRKRPCDVARLTHDSGTLYYINILSLGFVADVGALANRRFKRLGAAGYGVSVVANVATLHPRVVKLKLDDGRWFGQSAVFVSINNSRYTGGSMMMAPYADTADGKLDVIVAGEMGRTALLLAFPKIFSGTHVHLRDILATQSRVVELDEDAPVDLMIDGEVVTHAPRRVDLLEGAIDVCV